jgi:hypothetical protein
MAAKDIFHQQVVKALEKDGWTITDDPYLAIRNDVYAGLFALPEGQRLCEKAALKIIVFNADREEIVKWIN